MTDPKRKLPKKEEFQAWLEKHGIGGLIVTNAKDFGMVELWDDRCVRVLPNLGRPCCNAD